MIIPKENSLVKYSFVQMLIGSLKKFTVHSLQLAALYAISFLTQ